MVYGRVLGYQFLCQWMMMMITMLPFYQPLFPLVIRLSLKPQTQTKMKRMPMIYLHRMQPMKAVTMDPKPLPPSSPHLPPFPSPYPPSLYLTPLPFKIRPKFSFPSIHSGGKSSHDHASFDSPIQTPPPSINSSFPSWMNRYDVNTKYALPNKAAISIPRTNCETNGANVKSQRNFQKQRKMMGTKCWRKCGRRRRNLGEILGRM
mmetsp:Transcript_1866/g.2851  ORF Transcript_1866/g.2851 Transcript_1866/m.2851 type:complete len:205 (-) Transcript_1866:160-774(-)